MLHTPPQPSDNPARGTCGLPPAVARPGQARASTSRWGAALPAAPVLLLSCLAATAAIPGCGGGDGVEDVTGGAAAPRQRTLTLGAYTTPRDAYDGEIIPAFRAFWRESTGEELTVETSYQGSGGQSRAIVGGFPADVAALSLEPDVTRIAEAGLITHDWKADGWGGMVTASVAVAAIRPGNPKGIRDWSDLARDDVEVLTPNVRTSGGAMWNVAALYGAAMRGFGPVPKGDEEAATGFLGGVLGNVRIMDKGARESILTFEQGVGDAAITYENEVLTARLAGRQYEYVLPRSTILIVNPIAVVDSNVDAHGNRDVAEAFVQYVRRPETQRVFARYGYRPILPEVAAEFADRFAAPEDLFRIEDLGGWGTVVPHLFDPGGVYDKALERGQRK